MITKEKSLFEHNFLAVLIYCGFIIETILCSFLKNERKHFYSSIQENDSSLFSLSLPLDVKKVRVT